MASKGKAWRGADSLPAVCAQCVHTAQCLCVYVYMSLSLPLSSALITCVVGQLWMRLRRTVHGQSFSLSYMIICCRYWEHDPEAK